MSKTTHFFIKVLPSKEDRCPNAVYFLKDGDNVTMYVSDENKDLYLVSEDVALIDDETVSFSTVWSSSKVLSELESLDINKILDINREVDNIGNPNNWGTYLRFKLMSGNLSLQHNNNVFRFVKLDENQDEESSISFLEDFIEFISKSKVFKFCKGLLDFSGLTEERNIAFQDKSGVVALSSDIPKLEEKPPVQTGVFEVDLTNVAGVDYSGQVISNTNIVVGDSVNGGVCFIKGNWQNEFSITGSTVLGNSDFVSGISLLVIHRLGAGVQHYFLEA